MAYVYFAKYVSKFALFSFQLLAVHFGSIFGNALRYGTTCNQRENLSLLQGRADAYRDSKSHQSQINLLRGIKRAGGDSTAATGGRFAIPETWYLVHLSEVIYVRHV